MPNERLRAALLERGMTPAQLAATLNVDPKTVERWVTAGREPYRKHRYAVAALLGVDEAFLWPYALTPEQVASAAESEIITVYPHRWALPRDVLVRMFTAAERNIDILVYSGFFLSEDAGMLRLFAAQAGEGVAIRILFGDPDSAAVAKRGAEEGIDDALTAKVRNALHMYRPLRDIDNVEIRLHRTILYNSIYRADDQLLINAHIYGTPAANAPVLHLRRVAGGDLVTTYLESFNKVWATAHPSAT